MILTLIFMTVVHSYIKIEEEEKIKDDANKLWSYWAAGFHQMF